MNTITRAHLTETVYTEVGLSRNESADLVELVLARMSDDIPPAPAEEQALAAVEAAVPVADVPELPMPGLNPAAAKVAPRPASKPPADPIPADPRPADLAEIARLRGLLLEALAELEAIRAELG